MPLMEINRVGVIGGGQLAWMMAGAAKTLGITLAVQTPNNRDPACSLASETILASITDAEATARLASRCDAITFENEFIDIEALSALADRGVQFVPSLSVLEPLLDKYHQRCYLRDLGIPVPEFVALEDLGENLRAKIENPKFSMKWPLVMKARRHGYDGRGTTIVKDLSELEATWEKWGRDPVLLEEFVPFERELAAIAARDRSGAIAIYPIVETQQEEQVCRRVIAPAALEHGAIAECEEIARTILNSLQAVGVFGIELFLTPDAKILVNEIAPRTHNSGHFSLDASETSQFEQLLRVVCDRPLGSTALRSAGAVMVNLLGTERSLLDYGAKREELARFPGARLHWYGKTESRPGRKLGHVTVLLDKSELPIAREIAAILESIWYSSPD